MTVTDLRTVPGLSYSGAKTILDSPAKYRWERDHRTETPTPATDLGSAVHTLVLGDGKRIVVDYLIRDWRTKSAQQFAAKVRATGGIPLLWKDYQRAQSAARAVRNHPTASLIFRDGTPEVNLTWVDEVTGCPCKAGIDWLQDAPDADGLLVMADLKTTQSASPARFEKAVGDYGYFIQNAAYTDGARALGLAENVVLFFVAVEVDPPHEVSVMVLRPDDVDRALDVWRKAQAVYMACVESGEWPGYTTEVTEISVPPYVWRKFE